MAANRPKGIIIDTLVDSSSFDSYLLRHDSTHENLTLTLVLKIFLNPVDTGWLPFSLARDFDGNPFIISRWTAGDWALFKRRFLAQTRLWNDRFWLVPPASFAKHDMKFGAQVLRPNVYCHLFVDFVDSSAGAHHSISVVNLNPKITAASQGVAERDLTSGTFRSDDQDYDSLDVKARSQVSIDDHGRKHTHANYRTIVHEIGHALQLPHIGVSRGDPRCGVAIALDAFVTWYAPGRSLPAIYSGGSNAQVCYGDYAPAASGANVMGGGSQFGPTNAEPWTKRIANRTGTNMSDWKVLMRHKSPSAVR